MACSLVKKEIPDARFHALGSQYQLRLGLGGHTEHKNRKER